ncbi:transcription-repair coupling factor [Paenibacillus sp. TRM 82003]|uniref:transcription-repair coupling factor n=1 Tax=Kineococcus sp. TRM81007 TaxID=2925831 RepID=UPI001F581D1A|nr:transcription-repair coupling factor [Kineococcus sp. TRM81007]MCI2238410.1 transcription-repair coupling factor [Kineococcus sp. TRM81007]MCI3922077.1 transcription-repair coupling factor [Paenibacillus sp. TRM 82003]
MSLTGLLDVLRTEPAVRAAVQAAREGGGQALDVVAPIGVRPALLAALAAERPLLVVTATGRECEDLATWLRCYLPPHAVAEFPAWETLPHERLSPRSDTVAQRLAVLRRLAHPSDRDASTGEVRVVVAPVRAVLQPLVKGLADLEPVRLRAGDEIGLDATVEALVGAAYARVDMVERRGEFAVRGGILDVFPPTRPHPLRVEFFGDEVDEVRSFSVADQRSLEVEPDGVWAPPCRELLLTEGVRQRAAALVEAHPEAAEVLAKIAEGIAVEGMESLAPVLVDGMEPLLDVLPAGTHVVLAEPEKVRARAHDLVATGAEFLDAAWMNAAAGGQAPVDLGASSFWTLAQVRAHAESTGRPWWSVTSLVSDDDLRDLEDTRVLRVGARDVVSYRGETEKALADLRELAGAGWRIVVTTEGHGPAKRLVEVLSGEDVPARLVDDLVEVPVESVVAVTTASVEHGFVAEALKAALVTEADITGVGGQSTKDMRRMAPRRRRNAVDPLSLQPGDFVVHEQHGIGKFIEMVQRTVQGATREYLVLEYASSKRGQPGDRLFVPTDTLDQITRYTGGETPTLSKMGGSDWAKTKSKARKAVKQIAGDLIKLYSARMATKGHAFGQDTPWQRELEDAFPYVETPDQLASIDEVKGDMMKPVPMDRLICGDVGYGKTEIALRAAFKAVQDGKQVAVLVPTTLLVQQHFKTFAERYAQFPVSVKPLSRFTPGAEAKETIAGLADGSVDVVIGTHRLLSGEVKFKDLGLVVVDEEQRFGVEHKESLKTLRTNVDVLAMSATPIPRTLEMAVTGIREMSTLATPPEERHPVLTYVGGQEDKQIAAAIRRELLREGQVFYIHNRVQSIERTAARLKELVPEARIATAHGQMGEHRLEQVVVDFWEKKFDVLVCTTIVETGLDISNANTLIVERADAMGLSQLHQLRGRVGRGRERAYAYFLFPPEKPLTETAHDRLATIAQNTDLGSGMAVAMKDLEIRGAGNMLGGEQSGHIAGVGFDLYMRMVADAVADVRRQVPGAENDDAEPEPTEVKIELPVDAHLPHDYVPSERLRLEAYRRLAAADSDQDLIDLNAELTDRYGTPPQPVLNLLEVARFRIAARRVGLREVSLQGKQVRFAPIDLPESRELRLKRLYPGTILKPALSVALVPAPMTARIGGKPLRDAEMLAWAHEFVAAVLMDQPAAVAAGAR